MRELSSAGGLRRGLIVLGAAAWIFGAGCASKRGSGGGFMPVTGGAPPVIVIPRSHADEQAMKRSQASYERAQKDYERAQKQMQRQQEAYQKQMKEQQEAMEKQQRELEKEQKKNAR